MIITRTPFRITLGGGGTDLPSYYQRHGGFVVTSAIDKYMYVAVNTPFIDSLLRVKYSISETVPHVKLLKHDLAREALKHFGIKNALEILSFADISAGTGMGSSSCYLVGLLKALEVYRRRWLPDKGLAELACDIEMRRLKKPIGKQDAYIATFGGFLCMEISRQGNVKTYPARIKMSTVRDLEHNLFLYYSGIQRESESVLQDQHQAMQTKRHVRRDTVEKSLNEIKKIGVRSLKALEDAKLSDFGKLMDQHWQLKKRMSEKISNPKVDEAYRRAKACGALGGKLIGAGGGGFLLLYSEKNHLRLDSVMRTAGFRRLDFRFDFEGAKSLLNFMDSRIEYHQNEQKENGRG